MIEVLKGIEKGGGGGGSDLAKEVKVKLRERACVQLRAMTPQV